MERRENVDGEEDPFCCSWVRCGWRRKGSKIQAKEIVFIKSSLGEFYSLSLLQKQYLW